jgi:hypothetical protein
MNAPAKIDSQPEETVVRQKDKAAPRLAMVESQRRFGPAAIAALLLIAGVVAFAIFYNSQERSSTNGDSSAAVARVPDTREPTPASAKADRTAVNNRALSNTKREASDREQANERANEKKKDASDRERAAQLVNENKKEAKDRERANEKKKETAPMNSRSAVLKWQKAANAKQARRSVDAPALRLPNPEFANNLSAPSNESGTRGFGSATSAPKFFRAADGTLTVKFSDGSTRVVKPGERTARPE